MTPHTFVVGRRDADQTVAAFLRIRLEQTSLRQNPGFCDYRSLWSETRSSKLGFVGGHVRVPINIGWAALSSGVKLRGRQFNYRRSREKCVARLTGQRILNSATREKRLSDPLDSVSA